MVTTAVSLFIIDAIIFMGAETAFPAIDENEYLESLIFCIFFLIIAAGVMLLVYAGIQKDKYDVNKYNQMNDKKSEVYKKDSLTGSVCGCIMLIATILYLIGGFVFSKWAMPTIVVFAIGGVCCAIADIIINIKK